MPKRLDPIVAKLLAKDPAQRYATADQLQEDLDESEPFILAARLTGENKREELVVAVACGVAWCCCSRLGWRGGSTGQACR